MHRLRKGFSFLTVCRFSISIRQQGLYTASASDPTPATLCATPSELLKNGQNKFVLGIFDLELFPGPAFMGLI